MPKHRHFTSEFKAKVALEVIGGAKSGAEVGREYNLKSDLVSRWKAELIANAAQVFEHTDDADPQQARIAELERLAGKLSLELEVAKKVSALWASPASRNGN